MAWDIKVDGTPISWSTVKISLKLGGLNFCTIVTHLDVVVSSLQTVIVTFDEGVIFEGLVINRTDSETHLTVECLETAWELSRKAALGPSGKNCINGEADCLTYTFPTSTMKDIIESLTTRYGWSVGYTEDNPSVQDFTIDGENALDAVVRLIKVIGKMEVWFDGQDKANGINFGEKRPDAPVPVSPLFRNWKYIHDDKKLAECAAVMGKTSPDPAVDDIFGTFGSFSNDKFFEVYRKSEISTGFEAVDFAKKIVAKQGITINSFEPDTLVLNPIREGAMVSYDTTEELVEEAKYSVGASGSVKLFMKPPGMPKEHGDMLYWDGRDWCSLHPGVYGYALSTNGVGLPPSWIEVVV